MNLLISTWHLVVRAFVHIATTLHLYRLKSAVYRALFEREFRNVRLSVWHDIDSMVRFINRSAWRADSWETLFDAVSYPGKAQLVFEGKLFPKKNFDCDDFAIWLTASIHRSMWAGTLDVEVSGVGMMSVIWAERGFSVHGHNVCIFRAPQGFYAMDYGQPEGPFLTPAEAARNVVHRYSHEMGLPLVMCVHDYLLRPLRSETL